MKKLLTILLVLALVTSALGLSAFAATTPHAGTAAINFEKGDLVIDPVNPGTGALKDFGARSMTFQTFVITGDDATHTVLVDDTNVPIANQKVGVILTDARGEADLPWQITVGMTAFSAVGPSLGGFSLELVPAPAAIAGSIVPGNQPVINPGSKILTGGGAAVPVLDAHANGSLGKWGLEFAPILKTVGGTEIVGRNTATITWTALAV